jgi:ribosomal protein L40E
MIRAFAGNIEEKPVHAAFEPAMEKKAYQKICPICQMSNDPNAIICHSCGAHIELRPNVPTTRLVSDPLAPAEGAARPQEGGQPAPEGISIFLLNGGGLVALRTEHEFILGRAGESASDPLVDLTGFEAFSLGVSRHHALVKSTGDRYLLIDMNSSNGTWIDGQRLVPTRPYDLPSGAVIQLGRLKLIVNYMRPPRPKR